MAAAEIRPARGATDLHAAATLFQAYANGLGLDLAFQGFAAELAALPGAYAPPGGDLLLARNSVGNGKDTALGCVALRPLPAVPGACEMKRLFVAPAGRGLGLGRRLAEAALHAGAALGYTEMRLDTLERLAPALALYRALGFAPVPPYHAAQVPGLLFLGRPLPPTARPVSPGATAAA